MSEAGTVRDTEVIVRAMRPGEETAFRQLNEAWISRYFVLEPEDQIALQNPGKKILEPGGKVLMAVQGDEPIGCCALMPIGPGEFEVVKMAVTDRFQGRGIGRMLLTAIIEAARQAGATRLHLETNRILAPAIHLYESCGFQHIPAERITPSPYARSNVQMEMLLK